MQSAIGFDELFRFAEESRFDKTELSYPPYDIEKTGEDEYRISMALAGFNEDDIKLTVEGEILRVEGRATVSDKEEGRKFLYQGIARREFTRQFQLADNIRVEAASFKDGLLDIKLFREIPEHEKPRRIDIKTGGKKRKVIEGKAA
jgi:molecular chaperone IbpA